MEKIEYRVRPVTRFIVTRFEGVEHPDGSLTGTHSIVVGGEYDTEGTAYAVGYALCRAEHERLGYPPGDMRIIYPALPSDGHVPNGVIQSAEPASPNL